MPGTQITLFSRMKKWLWQGSERNQIDGCSEILLPLSFKDQ